MTNAAGVDSAQYAATLAKNFRAILPGGSSSPEWQALGESVWDAQTKDAAQALRQATEDGNPNAIRRAALELQQKIAHLTDGPGRALGREVYTPQVLDQMRQFGKVVGYLAPSSGSLKSRLADPDHHREAATSRPLLLQAIGRQTSHAGRPTMTITSRHGAHHRARQAPTRIAGYFTELRKTAEHFWPDQHHPSGSARTGRAGNDSRASIFGLRRQPHKSVGRTSSNVEFGLPLCGAYHYRQRP
jgi:hypothetical protein